MLVRLKEPLDLYHRRRTEKHGWLYTVEVEDIEGVLPISGISLKRYSNLLEARSIATGVVCTLLPKYVETVDALQRPEGSELPA